VPRLFALHDGKYGAPRITADLRDAGWRVSENTVAALMREQYLAARRKKRRRGTTRPGKGRWRAPDLVKRDFPASQINRKWFGDGTEIPTGEGKLHLVSVLDAGSRGVLGFTLGERHDAQLAYGALAMALAIRGGQAPGVIFHTDQGSEYTARLFRRACERLDVTQSMGRPGSALDNAETVRRLRHPGPLQQDRQPGHPLGHHHPLHPGRPSRDHRRQRNTRPDRPAHHPRSSFGFGITTWSGQNTMITNKERGQAQRARTERAAASVSSR
jgi:hypothetical protein